MKWLGINSLFDLLEFFSFIATIIGGIAILFAVRDYSISRKQLHLSVLQSCVSRFREHFMDLNPESPPLLVRDYLDLVNEEMFYFEQQYLPLEVAHEWLDGMIHFIPIFDGAGQILNQGYCLPQIVDEKMLENYHFRRIRRIFTVEGRFDMESIYKNDLSEINRPERERLLRYLLYNIRTNWKKG
ncbi:MAG: hypothetical protein AAGM67_20310 [Bacteroidota bacterium]